MRRGWMVVLMWGMAACDPAVFHCDEDVQCRAPGMVGRCEASGFCSFNDDACTSGRRYVEGAPLDIAGRCVPIDPSTDPCPSCLDSPESVVADSSCGAARDFDILLVLDTSESAWPAHAALGEALSSIGTALGTGDLDGDGLPERVPARSIHAGVVSADLGDDGLLPEEVSSCTLFGDDARMVDPSRCPGAAGNHVEVALGPGGMDVGPALECVAQAADLSACGLEQPLEASVRALATDSSGIAVPDRPPHGDGFHQGFLRDGSVLVVVVVTDEDDCSLADPLQFPDSQDPSWVARGCTEGNATFDPSRYSEALTRLRPDSRDLVFVAITGVPGDLVVGQSVDAETILADPRMDVEIDPLAGVVPVCSNDQIHAAPARRLVEVTGQLDERGAYVRLASICAPTPASWSRAVIEALAQQAACAES